MSIWDSIKSEFVRTGSAVHQIILVNLAVFVFTILIGFVAVIMNSNPSDLLQYFYLSSDIPTTIVRPWTLVTNIFFHSGFSHIFWNMLLLYFIGRILEDFLSPGKIWSIFIGGGILGGLLFIGLYNISPAFTAKIGIPLLGASGGVTAIIVATGIYLPFYNIRPFGLFTVQMRWVALFFVFRDLYTFPFTNNTGGLLAHLGGALFGLLFVFDLQGKIKLPRINLQIRDRKKVDERNFKRATRKPDRKPNQDEIDAILDKISHSGYDSLTEKEKETLFRAGE